MFGWEYKKDISWLACSPRSLARMQSIAPFETRVYTNNPYMQKIDMTNFMCKLFILSH